MDRKCVGDLKEVIVDMFFLLSIENIFCGYKIYG